MSFLPSSIQSDFSTSTGISSFLEPLERKEEKRHFNLFFNNQSKHSYDTIILTNLGFVAEISNYYESYGIPLEDIFQIGVTGLIQALPSYNVKSQYRFSAFAKNKITKEIENYLIKNKSIVSKEISEDISLNSQANKKDVSLKATVNSMISPQSDFVESMHMEIVKDKQFSLLSKNLASLSKRSEELMTKRYLEDNPFTLARLANYFQLSRGRIDQIEKACMKKLRHPSRWHDPDFGYVIQSWYDYDLE